MKILYLAWLGSNNLGDVYMWEIFRKLSLQYLDQQRFEVIPSLPHIDLSDLDPYDLIVLGGGSIIHPKYIRILHQALQLKKHVMIWGSGIDSLDKEYMNHYHGRSNSIPPLFSTEIQAKLKTILHQSIYTGVRGPLTYHLLREMNLPVAHVEQSLDPGLLVEPTQTQPVSPQKELKGKWLALNWGTSYNKIFGGSEIRVENQLVKAIRHLIQKGYHIYLYTVWWRDRKPAQRLYEKIGDKRHVYFDPNIYHYLELIEILKQCQLTINLKLHANVLSAVAKVPFIALGYRIKVFDFALSLGLQNLVLFTDDPRLSDKIVRMTSKKSAYQKILHTQMAQYLPIALRNLTKPFQIIRKINK